MAGPPIHNRRPSRSGFDELAEREREAAVLRRVLHDLEEGAGAIVAVAGEAGIGKSALVEALLGEVAPGVRIWRGDCDDLVAANPLGPLREAWSGEPLDGQAAGDAVLTPTDQHLHRVLTWVGDRLEGGPPTLLVVEDLHWADDATVDVLGYLARRASRYPLVMLFTYRPEDAHRHPAVQRFLARLPTTTFRRLVLAPLSPAAVALMAQPTGWDAQDVHQVTGGNPFFVTETLAGTPRGPLPATVTAAVSARLQALSPAARQALERVSVWPGNLAYDLAEDLLGPELPALEEAERSGVLVSTADGIRFRHELARRAVVESLPRLRHRRLQRQIVDVLVGRNDADLPRLAHHAIAASDGVTVAAVAPQAAAASARAGAHRQALVLYRAALDHEPLLDRPGLAAVLDGYAWELYNARQFAGAVEHGRRAVELYGDRGDQRRQAGALVRLSRHLMMHGNPPAAQQAAARAVGLLDHDDRGWSRAMVALGSVQALTTGNEEARKVLEQARQRAVADGQVATEALCLNYLSLVDPVLEDDERIGLLHRSRALATGAGDFEVVARSHTNLAELLYRFGRYDDLAVELEESLAFTAERGFWSHAHNLEVHAALLAGRRGDGATALELLRAAADRFDDPGMLRGYALAPFARLRARQGDTTAGAVLAGCWEQALHQGLLVTLGFAGTGLMEWAWLREDRALAASIMSGWQPHAARPTAAPIDAELRRYALLLDLEPLSPAPHGDLSRYPFGLALAGDHRAEADRWAAVGDRYEEAIELVAGAEPAGVTRGRSLLRSMGAGGTAIRLGSGDPSPPPSRRPVGPRRPAGNPAGLTARQMDVLRLMSDGMTNAEIATELYLSVRTVDHHVSSILTRLGVPNRRAATRTARLWPSG